MKPDVIKLSVNDHKFLNEFAEPFSEDAGVRERRTGLVIGLTHERARVVGIIDAMIARVIQDDPCGIGARIAMNELRTRILAGRQEADNAQA